MSEQKSVGLPIWAAPAIVTEIGQGDDGHDIVGLKLYGKEATLPVNLPSEARQIGPHLGRRVTVALLTAPDDGKSIEEQLVWHRAEVDRLRELLAAKPEGEAEARFEVGRQTLVVTLRGADAEQKVAKRAAELMAGEHMRRQLAAAKDEAARSNKERALLARAMRSALLIIDAVTESEKRGEIRVSATHGSRWDDLRDFAADPAMREWLRVTAEDKAFINKCAPPKQWTPGSWNTCLKCHQPVEKAGGDVEFFDGDEANCTGCGATFVVSVEENGAASLCESESAEADESVDEEPAR